MSLALLCLSKIDEYIEKNQGNFPEDRLLYANVLKQNLLADQSDESITICIRNLPILCENRADVKESLCQDPRTLQHLLNLMEKHGKARLKNNQAGRNILELIYELCRGHSLAKNAQKTVANNCKQLLMDLGLDSRMDSIKIMLSILILLTSDKRSLQKIFFTPIILSKNKEAQLLSQLTDLLFTFCMATKILGLNNRYMRMTKDILNVFINFCQLDDLAEMVLQELASTEKVEKTISEKISLIDFIGSVGMNMKQIQKKVRKLDKKMKRRFLRFCSF